MEKKINNVESSLDRGPILVVGADGMIGSRLVTSLRQKGVSVLGTTRNKNNIKEGKVFFDLNEVKCVSALPFAKISAAVICAAITSIDLCRQEPVATREINVKNTVALAKRLVAEGIYLIFISSNTVFDGNTPFSKATDKVCPQSEYGCQKADAEEQLMALGGQVAVTRFSKVISPDMPLLTSWVRDLQVGKIIHPISDARMAPISVAFTVELLVSLLELRLTGIIQASSCNEISYETAATYLAEKLRVDKKLIKSVSSLQKGLPIFPANTTLDPTKLNELGIKAPPAMQALDQFCFGNYLFQI